MPARQRGRRLRSTRPGWARLISRLAALSVTLGALLLAPAAGATEYEFAASDGTECVAETSRSSAAQPDGNWTVSSDVRLACNRSVHMAAVSTWLDTPDKRNEWEAPWRGEAGCNFIWGEVCDADDFPLGAGFDATDVAPGTYAVWTRVWVDLRTGNAQQGGPAWLLMPTAEHDRSYEPTGCLPVTAPVVAGPAQLDYANCVFRDEVVLG